MRFARLSRSKRYAALEGRSALLRGPIVELADGEIGFGVLEAAGQARSCSTTTPSASRPRTQAGSVYARCTLRERWEVPERAWRRLPPKRASE